MKKFGLFLGGIATGVILTFLVLFLISERGEKTPDGITNFNQPGEVIKESSVRVFQVVSENAALVAGEGWGVYNGPVYLLRNYNGNYYYDEQIIQKPKGKVFRQTGIYQYDAKSGDHKTVAIIELQ